MSLVRKVDLLAAISCEQVQSQVVFLIEDSVALALLLKERIETETGSIVVWCKTFAAARDACAAQLPDLAITGMDLPDAPHGEMLDLLNELDVPTVLYTTMMTRKVRDRVSAYNLTDYVIKDSEASVDRIIEIVRRFLANSKVKILIVDDKASARATLANLLFKQNHPVLQAETGDVAIAMLQANEDVQIVLTDYYMPDMDGYELTKRISSMRPPGEIRIIGISASSDPFLSASFLKAGAVDFVYRPYNPEEVRCRINSNVDTITQIRRLRFLAERDPLTGLFNRRAFFERAQGRLKATAVDGSRSVAILDIDHFKRVNDTYGHDTGDAVIVEVARVLEDAERRGDVLAARFGGEEFALLLSECTSDRAFQICDELRLAIEALTIPYETSQISVTASIGLAMFQHGEGLDNNLNAADQMLYMAKGGGRNQVFSDAALYSGISV